MVSAVDHGRTLAYVVEAATHVNADFAVEKVLSFR